MVVTEQMFALAWVEGF